MSDQNQRFAGRHAVVTGGAQGIGFAVATQLLTEGSSVSLWDVDPIALADAAGRLELPQRVDTVVVDITDEAAVAHASEHSAALATIDVLVHCAGIAGPASPLVDYPVAEWRKVVDIDLTGAFLVNQAVARRMIAAGYGRIVNVASVAGKEGNPSASAYSAAKAGLIAMTKSLGKELAGYDIAVNAVTPAAAQTRLLEQVSQAHVDYMLSKIPRGRFVTVEEIASLVCWLASEANSFSTGAIFDISGGRATY